MNREIFDDFDSNGNMDHFFDSGFPSARSNFVSDFFGKPFEHRSSFSSRSPTFRSSNERPMSSFGQRNGQSRPNDHVEGNGKVHVIPIIVEGREQPLGKRQTSTCDNSNDEGESQIQRSNESEVRKPQESVPIAVQVQSQTPSVQREHSSTSSPRSVTPNQERCINIPIQIERNQSPPLQFPQFGNHSDSNLGGNLRFKSSAPGQKSSSGIRPQSASFSNLPSNAPRSAKPSTAYANSNNHASASTEHESTTAATASQPQTEIKKTLSPVEQISEIVEEVKKWDEQVNSFQGSKGDKQYRYLDEYLTRSLLKLDQIETNGISEIRQARKGAITFIESVISKLENIGKPKNEEAQPMELDQANDQQTSEAKEEPENESNELDQTKSNDSEACEHVDEPNESQSQSQ